MVLVLDKTAVEASLSLPQLVSEIRQGMIDLSEGRVTQPLRTRVFSSATGGLLACLPCYLSGDEIFAAKLGFSHPTLRDQSGTRHLDQIIALGNTEGKLLSVMHATSLGMFRTAACSAAVAAALSPRSAHRLAIIGCGPMGRAEAATMSVVRNIGTISVFDTNPAAMQRFRETVRLADGCELKICRSAEEAVKEAEIVSLATTSTEPVLNRAWLTDHCHVAALGAHRKTHREVDSDTMAEAAVFAESREALMAEAGDFLVPIGENRYDARHCVGEIGELFAGRIDEAAYVTRLTVFKSTGVGIQDLVIACHVYQRAIEKSLGIEIDL